MVDVDDIYIAAGDNQNFVMIAEDDDNVSVTVGGDDVCMYAGDDQSLVAIAGDDVDVSVTEEICSVFTILQ